MTLDIRSIAIDAVLALKCALNTIDQLKGLLQKRAALLLRPAQALVCLVVHGLVKAGKLAHAEALPAVQLILSDANAALRCIRLLLTESPYTKTASLAVDNLLSVGKLISTSKKAAGTPAAEDGREAALRILKTEL